MSIDEEALIHGIAPAFSCDSYKAKIDINIGLVKEVSPSDNILGSKSYTSSFKYHSPDLLKAAMQTNSKLEVSAKVGQHKQTSSSNEKVVDCKKISPTISNPISFECNTYISMPLSQSHA